MKNLIEEYIPFEHDNVGYINSSLNLARQQREGGTLEGIMSSIVIYTNLVEYLTNNLLENLQQMIFLLSYRYLNAVVFVKSKGTAKVGAPKTLGHLRGMLSDYEFPDSFSFLDLLQRFSETRNWIFHRLLTLSKGEMDQGKVDKQFSNLRDLAEEILNNYNSITKGITTIWLTLKARIQQETQ